MGMDWSKASKKHYDTVEEKVKVLKLELDYHLLSLHDAIVAGDVSVQEIEKRNLEAIHSSLDDLKYFAVTSK